MINFCPPGTPITVRKALKNVLQSRRVYQSRRRRFFYSPRCDRAHPDTSRSLADLIQMVGTLRRCGVGFKRLPPDPLPVGGAPERDRTHVPVPRGVQVDPVRTVPTAPNIRLGHDGSVKLWLPV